MSKSLAPDVRQKVYLVFIEAVNNAVKYSNGDMLWVQLDQKGSGVNLNIKDNGRVDPSSIKTSGLGLSNMKMRSDRVGGQLTIDHSDGFVVSLVI